MTDIAATILNFFFRQDKKEHPMPAQAQQTLLQKMRNIIYRNEEPKHG